MLLAYISLSISVLGSLAVFVPTQRGMLVCSDRREYNRITGATDSTTKITKLGPRAAFVVTGANAILDTAAQHTLFAMQHVIVEFFAKRNIADGNLEKHFEEFRQFLSARYSAVGLRIEQSAVIHFVYVPLGSGVQIKQCELLPTGEVNCVPLSIEMGALADGKGEVLTEIVRGRDPRFSDLRADISFRDVWLNKTPSTNTVYAAQDFASKAITWTHERYLLIGSGPNLVSPNYDCALISPEDGFSWLVRDSKR